MRLFRLRLRWQSAGGGDGDNARSTLATKDIVYLSEFDFICCSTLRLQTPQDNKYIQVFLTTIPVFKQQPT